MFVIQDILVSLDVIEEHFSCDLNLCKGRCCVEGDAGAPITDIEIDILQQNHDVYKSELTKEAQDIINEKGLYYYDESGEKVLSIVGKKECVFCKKTSGGIHYCVLERLYEQKKIGFQKPMSCRLYPLREVIIETNGMQRRGLEYNRWDICNESRMQCRKHGMKLYEFLKSALIDKFGQSWYDELKLTADEWNKQYRVS